jgi:hypothetical protein
MAAFSPVAGQEAESIASKQENAAFFKQLRAAQGEQ